jgi:hypothetical protein
MNKTMKNLQRGSSLVWLVIVLAVVIIGGSIYLYGSNDKSNGSNEQVSLATSTPQTSGLSTYNNFGISFQYPSGWGIPHESFFGTSNNESVTFDALNASDTQPLMIDMTQDTNPQTGGPENETFDQMIARFRTNDQLIYLVKDLTINGITGRELFYNSAVTGQPYHADAYFQLQNGWYVVFGADFQSVPQDAFEKIISTFKFDNNTVAKEDAATGMFAYANNGIQFEYPGKLATDYGSLDIQTSVEKAGSVSLDSNGCYSALDGSEERPSTTSVLTINNVPFCYRTSGDVGAGQAYTTYSYTTSRDGNVYGINYIVHTSNGCGVYENSNDPNAPGNEKYKECLAFGANYATLVTKPVQDSIASFKFSN